MISKLWRRQAANLALPAGDAIAKTIGSTEQLAYALYRERARSDRNRSSFSMIAIKFPKAQTPLITAATFEILKSRLRITDEFGWLPDGRVGVVLSETPYDGAVRVLRDLEERLYLEATGWEFAIFVYPQLDSQEPDDSGEGGDDRDGPCPENLDTLFAQHMPAWKRIADLVGAVAGIVMLSPLLLGAALLVRLSSPGPILFSQWRHTVGGKPFRIYKFRTMCQGAETQKAKLRAQSEQDGPAFKLRRDPRVTTVGKFLRATSIDELPQLFNILRGEMSLVGPRPLPCDESAACSSWQRSRLDVTPGLTCIWQVSGRSTVSFDDWMRMDRFYIRKRSPWLDAKLVARTFGAVFGLTGR